MIAETGMAVVLLELLKCYNDFRFWIGWENERRLNYIYTNENRRLKIWGFPAKTGAVCVSAHFTMGRTRTVGSGARFLLKGLSECRECEIRDG